MKCVYHGDMDGRCAGAIVRRKFSECVMIEMNYGDRFPWELLEGPEETLFMVDFSLATWAEMERLQECCHLVWIDHHKTALENEEAAVQAGKRRPAGARCLGLAGCELAWSYFMESTPPEAVRLLGRYDVWDKAHDWDRRLAFQYGIRLRDTRPESPTNIFGFDKLPGVLDEHLVPDLVDMIVEDGKLVRRHREAEWRGHAGHCAFAAKLDGLRCLAMPGSPKWGSEAFASRWDAGKFDAMLQFYATKNGVWTVCMYSDTPGIDVGAVAKRRGGGGHAGAAGFQAKQLPAEILEAMTEARA